MKVSLSSICTVFCLLTLGCFVQFWVFCNQRYEIYELRQELAWWKCEPTYTTPSTPTLTEENANAH